MYPEGGYETCAEETIRYDLTELENSARFKKGAEQVRTPKKIDSVNQWFTKFDGDTANFLTYFGKSRQTACGLCVDEAF